MSNVTTGTLSTTRYRRSTDVIETDLGNEMVLLDPATQQMFALNATGRALWLALRTDTLGDAVTRLTTAFDVPRHHAERDARALVAELLEAGLLLSHEA